MADAASQVQQAEEAWLARLAEIEPGFRLRIEDPGTAAEEWNGVVQVANEARDEADARMDDLLYAVEMVIDAM